MFSSYLIIILILLICSSVSVWLGKLTTMAGIAGCIVGLLIYTGAGYTGIAMLGTFFILGTSATAIGHSRKQRLGLAEQNKGRRTTAQVFANAGIASLLALLMIVMPGNSELLRLMIAGSLASATADTLSSELGNVYGKVFYNIITFRKDRRGLDGVVSAEGTAAGVFGSTAISLVYATGSGHTMQIIFIVIAGTLGNLFDSVLGATLERKHYVNNNVVNFLNTAIAALIICCIYLIANAS